uniref:aldehyde dehydrogenase family protein n=1 Tax=Streptomyces venezuelae TaxID=54571 RepID=UPI001F178969
MSMDTTTTDTQPMLIGGEWITSEDGAIDSVNPATGRINRRVTAASAAQVDAAVAAARDAASAKG